MDYKKYIELGFERYDLNCSIEFSQTGYRGFSLEIDVNDRIRIIATSGNLDKPKLYIKKRDKDAYHIIDITGEIVMDLLKENSYVKDDFMRAC